MRFNFLGPVSAANFYIREFRIFVRDLIRSEDAIAVRSLKALAGSERARSAFVFGNGPSLSKLSPHKVDNLLTREYHALFCVNNFIFSDFFATLSAGSDINLVLSDPAMLSAVHFKALQFALDCLKDKRLNRLYIPSSFREKVLSGATSLAAEILEYEKDSRVRYFDNRQSTMVYSRNISPVKPRCYSGMTLYKALAVAGYLGFDHLYICGMDNTYARGLKCDEQNRVYRVDCHFDRDAYPLSSRPDYHWAHRGVDMAGALMETAVLFADLRAKFSHLPVLNLDPESLVDAFSKTSKLDVYL